MTHGMGTLRGRAECTTQSAPLSSSGVGFFSGDSFVQALFLSDSLG